MDNPVSPSDLLISDQPPALAPFEVKPAGEDAAIQTILAAIETRVRATAAQGRARRDAHPKAHGLVQAEFRVLDGLPDELRQGLFARPARYGAWIRFSNGSETPQGDALGDGRGMAVKVTGVAGSRSGTQDFIMINNPAFFVRNAEDYVAFQTAANPLGFFFPGWNPFRFRLHELFIARAITGRRVSNPLSVQYWSMTPYLFGAAACKYSARPVGPVAPFQDRVGANFLHDNLARTLAQGEAAFDFCIQLRRRPDQMPIEDPTLEWPEALSPFIPVARITLPRQGFDEPGQVALAENLSFTPWHGLDAHRPLGGISRARRTVYAAISRLRHTLNGEPEREPDPPSLPLPPPPVGAASPESPMADWLSEEFGRVVGAVVDNDGWLDKQASRLAINGICASTRNRPHPWSTASDYTSWKSLTDRTYQARHRQTVQLTNLPDPAAVQALFKRPDGAQTLSPKSTCLFPAFAQYLTDGFIRTRMDDRSRTTTNHEIDLCPLYGRNEAQTDILRENSNAAGRKGRLKTQVIGGEEFAPLLYPDGTTNPVSPFERLDPPLLGVHPPAADQLKTLFAFGGDRANSTPFSAMMNTLFLREHNRVAGVLEQRNPGWDDERVFQTARNIMIPIFIKIVVEQYINHITPLPFNLVADPSVAWTANWNRPNWITAEFSLLYRWHSLMPDAIDWAGAPIPLAQFTLRNAPLIEVGLGKAFAIAAAQPAAELGAFNTGDALLLFEMLAVAQARSNHLDTYNNYRIQFGVPAATSFAEISSDPKVQALLEQLYGVPDNVEFYPGLFAEDRTPKSPLPGLLLRMVAVDAFTQALTNPLLSEHVFNAATFTDWGLDLIQQTRSLGDILVRLGLAADPKPFTMTQPGWRY